MCTWILNSSLLSLSLLSPPLIFTELFLVQDTSVDFQETWQFLQRRMEDAKSFGNLSKEVYTQFKLTLPLGSVLIPIYTNMHLGQHSVLFAEVSWLGGFYHPHMKVQCTNVPSIELCFWEMCLFLFPVTECCVGRCGTAFCRVDHCEPCNANCFNVLILLCIQTMNILGMKRWSDMSYTCREWHFFKNYNGIVCIQLTF